MRRTGILVLLVMLAVSTGAAFRFYLVAQRESLRLAETSRRLEELRHSAETQQIPAPEWSEIGKALKSDTPQEALRSSLLARTDLIPWEGVLGGRMAIPGPESIWFIAPNWALAYVEDGHIAGYLLFRFRIRGNRIEWTPLDNETL
jgi:hypothetical protein